MRPPPAGARWVMAIWAVLVLLAAALPAEEQCGVCHPESRVAHARSIHASEEIVCTDCHGGDPDERRVEPAHRGDFRGLTDRLSVPEMCAECHADQQKMRGYNLPIDQFAVYRTSQHGETVSRGDGRAAVCSDCHGVHDIRGARDPESAVHPRRVAATCGVCHADAELMREFDLDPGVVEAYGSGVHGVALVELGNTAAPNCTSCHGTHGPAPPGVGDVDKVCGACHVETRRAFLNGSHAVAMTEAGLPECASCHSNHGIRRLSIDNVDEFCAECHDAESGEVVLGRKLHSMIASAEAEVDKAETLAREAEQAAIHVEDHLGRIEEARTYITEGLPLVHAVALEPVDLVVRRARSIGLEVQHELYAKLDKRPARVGLVIFWFYVLMTLVILVSFKRRLRRRGGEG